MYIQNKNKENILNLTVQYAEKYSNTVQQLADKAWLAHFHL